MHGHDSIGWRHLVDQNIKYNMTTIQYTPVQSNPASQIFSALAGLGLGFGAVAIAASAEQQSQNAQTAQQTAQIFNAYSMQKAAIATAEAELQDLQNQSDAYAKDLTYLENQKSHDDALQGQIDAHQNNYSAAEITQQFDNLNTNLQALNNFKNGAVKNYNTQLAQKQQALQTAQGKPTTGTTSHANKKFELKGTAEGGAANKVTSNRNQYNRQVRGSDGKYTQQLDEAGYNADLQLARQLDANAKAADDAKKALTDHVNTKSGIKCSYGDGKTANIDNIDNEISGVSQELEALKQQQVNSNDGTANTTFADYKSKLDDLKGQQAHNAEVKDLGKEQIKQKKKAVDAEITAKKQEIAAAKKELAKLEAVVKDAQASANRILTDEQNLADAKQSVKDARRTGADGGKRSWWQRLWGTNKSDALKTARQERRDARQQLKRDNQYQNSVYGFGVDENYRNALNNL